MEHFVDTLLTIIRMLLFFGLVAIFGLAVVAFLKWAASGLYLICTVVICVRCVYAFQ